MEPLTRPWRTWPAVVAIALVAVLCIILNDSMSTVGEGAEPASPPRTLRYRPPSQSGPGLDANVSAATKTRRLANSSQVLSAQVSVFYPSSGQNPDGYCWMGLTIDSEDNVYPINGLGFYKILPNGVLVNGVDDQDLFASGGHGSWGELDASGGQLYTAADSDVRSAPFLEGGTFSTLLGGLKGGQALAVGQGPLAGSLLVTESANQVSRVTLSPLRKSVFASGASFSYPQAIVSAPDGTLYVVNRGFNPAQLTKVTPAGMPSLFSIGTEFLVNGAVAVDRAGDVYWSQAAGMNKYDASGHFLGMLPGPPDKVAYEYPMGAAFDSHGSLYIVDNYGCKTIYKYSGEALGSTLGASVTGITPQTALCKNTTTEQSVPISTPASSWDCEAAGLEVGPGDQVVLRVQGPVKADARDVGGAVVGMAPTSGGCSNRTTGQEVSFQHMVGATMGSCVAAGLVVHPGDTVQMRVQGVAD